MTDLLIDSPLTSEHLEYVESIRQCGYTFIGIVNDILDLSKLEAYKMEIYKTTF